VNEKEDAGRRQKGDWQQNQRETTGEDSIRIVNLYPEATKLVKIIPFFSLILIPDFSNSFCTYADMF